MSESKIHQDEDHDIVWGRLAIGKVINRDARAVEYLARRYPAFPMKKVGGNYVASKKELLAFIRSEAVA